MVFAGREDEVEDGCEVVLFYKKKFLPEALDFSRNKGVSTLRGLCLKHKGGMFET